MAAEPSEDKQKQGSDQPGGDGQEWAVVRVVESNEEAILATGFLNSNGIPAQVESLHVEELPVNVGGLGEVRVRVPAARLAEAQALLDQSDQSFESALPDGEGEPDPR
jgi:hypothetical protein